MDSSGMLLTKRPAIRKDERIALNIENIHRRYQQGNDVLLGVMADIFNAILGPKMVHTNPPRIDIKIALDFQVVFDTAF